jgi:hypothetical protein
LTQDSPFSCLFAAIERHNHNPQWCISNFEENYDSHTIQFNLARHAFPVRERRIFVLGCRGETVKLNFAVVGLTALGSESLAKLFRDDSPILTIVEPSPTTLVDQPNTDKAVLEDNVIETEGDEGNATTAEQPRSVLDGLNLDTAIRLRWVLRDIKGRRTKFLPVGQNDLMALIELGLIEMQNAEPALTNEGMRAIAHSTGPDEGERGE